MGTINAFITEHPALTAGVLATFQLVLTWLWASLKWFVVRELKTMEEHEGRQDTSIEKIEQRLNKNDVSYAVSATRFDQMFTMLKNHVDKEDEQHAKLEDIRVNMASIEALIKRNGA